MADRKNIVTLGIGASPGKLTWFLTSGLESGAEVTYTVTDEPITLPAYVEAISLDNPLESVIADYRETVVLVNQNGDTLVNQNGDSLVGVVVRSVRTNIVNLGA